ncbi:MAG: phosphoribosylanthranilate isomerase [Chloroflexi bacterium]|nr:phosphoribosylanthranilate isomerase [Chloroflexota bacterium]
MKVQIYTMQTPDEAIAAAQIGVDHIGVTPSNCGLPGEISHAAARAIFEALPEGVTKVALSVDNDLDAIEAMARAVQPDIVHLCGPRGAVPPDAVRTLRERLPGVQIMQAISVAGPEALDDARSYHAVADYLLLDTQAPDIGGIGASGATHDWNISRAIVAESPIPVILAGGLSPENVAEAIRAVRPWGVDSLTHTNRPLPEGGFRKDLDRVRAFVAAAKQVVLA